MGLLEIIDRTFVGDFVRKKSDIIQHTNPDKIYVENIRSFFGISTKLAKALCELAVRSGRFEKYVGFICPNDNCRGMLYEAKYDSELDPLRKCLHCEIRGDEAFAMDVSGLDKVIFYRLK